MRAELAAWKRRPRSMVSALVVGVAIIAVASAAHARRRRTPQSIRVALAPFEGKHAALPKIRETIDLELSLEERLAVVPGEDLPLNDDKDYSRGSLRRLMRKHKLNALVRGTTRWHRASGGSRLHVVIYGADGRARLHRVFDVDGVDSGELGLKIAAQLMAKLTKWRRAKAVRLRLPPKQAPAKKAPKGARDETVADGQKPSTDDKTENKVSTSTEDSAAAPGPDKTAAVDDDSVDDKANNDARENAQDDSQQASDLTPWFAASFNAGGATWFYDIAAADSSQDDGFWATVYPGQRVDIELWAFDMIGWEAHAASALYHFATPSESSPVLPREFYALSTVVSSSLRARYVYEADAFGIGAGARLGYRYHGAHTRLQTHSWDHFLYTRVPGFQYHALVVGMDIAVPIRALERRILLDVRADSYPLGFYAEHPDTVGAESLSFGGAAELTLRLEIIAGVFVSLSSGGSAIFSQQTGEGTRRSHLLPGLEERPLMTGGDIVNATGSFFVGVGAFY